MSDTPLPPRTSPEQGTAVQEILYVEQAQLFSVSSGITSFIDTFSSTLKMLGCSIWASQILVNKKKKKRKKKSYSQTKVLTKNKMAVSKNVAVSLSSHVMCHYPHMSCLLSDINAQMPSFIS